MKIFKCATLAILNLSLVPALCQVSENSQQAATDDPVIPSVVLGLTRTRAIMREPGGLEKISNLIGKDIIFTNSEERWGEHNLQSLVGGSDVVAIGTISEAKGQLSQDGDSVDTKYTVALTKSLKGEPATNISVVVRGGQFKFSNGHTVTIRTPAFDALQVNQSYIFFLKKVDTGFQLVGSSQGIFELSTASNVVHLTAENSQHNESLHQQVDGRSIDSVEDRIRGFVQE